MTGYRTTCRLALLTLVVSGSSGCAENDSMLFIRGAMARKSGSCELVADSSAVLLTNGVYDIAFKQAYYGALLVGNQLASRGQKTRSRTETSSITLEGAEVTLRLPGGKTLRDPFTAPGTGFIEVGSGQDSGYGVMSAVLIPWSSADAALAAELSGISYTIAEIKVFGSTLGGQDVESGVFKFPISVCSGCLVAFPMSSLNASGACVANADAESSIPCAVGQDDPVNCAACAGRYDVCRAP